MKFLFVAATAIATASAFTTSPAAFTTSVPQVGGVSDVFSNEGNAHRNRRSTIVMDGKANGELVISRYESISGESATVGGVGFNLLSICIKFFIHDLC